MADIKVGLELKGRLPDEYQEVEYIRSNGTQYINTLIKINPYTKVVCDFRFIEIPNSNQYLFGSLDESTNCFAVYRSSGGVFSYQFTDGWVNNKWTNIPIDTNRHLVELDALNKIIKIDNGNTLDEVISTSITTVSTMPLYIFSRSNSRGDLSEFSSIELYSFKVYQNNALKNNFVPCYNKNTKIAGLYDTYNNKFFENAVDGDDFIVGENANINEATLEDISLIQNARIPLEFQEVEYIESTGTQYIDTGIVGESGVYVQCKIEMMEIQEGCIIGARSGGVRYSPIHIYQEVFGFGNGSSWVASTYKPVINTIYEIQSSIKSTSQSFSINGSTVISKNENSQNNTNLNMFLFAMNTDGTNRLSSKFRLYNMIIANTLGQVVRNFVPCYRVSDRATGLYDLLSKEFFPNLGSGEFLLGENKGNIVEVSNTSILLTGDTFNKLSEKNNGLNMKSWASGYLSLSDGFVGGKDSFLSKQNGYDGYVFGEVSNNNEYPVTLQVNGEQIKWILIYGDKSANQFPTEIIVDGKTISNNSVMCIVGFEKMANSHQVEFVKWNRANYNACITYIEVMNSVLILDNKYLKGVETLTQITAQGNEISYNPVNSRGSLEIIDINGEIKDYINDGILDLNNLNAIIQVNGNDIQSHICKNSTYQNNSFSFSCDLEEHEMASKSITLNMRDYDDGQNIPYSEISLKEILVQYVYDGKNIDDMLQENTMLYYDNDEITIDTYLQLIRLKYFYLYNATKNDILNYVCQIAQITLVQKTSGKKVFVSMRPKVKTYKAISIPKSRIFKPLDYDLVVNNRYDRVEFELPTIKKQKGFVLDSSFAVRDSDAYGWGGSYGAYSANATLQQGAFATNVSQSDVPTALSVVKFYYKVNYSDNEYYDFRNAKWIISKEFLYNDENSNFPSGFTNNGNVALNNNVPNADLNGSAIESIKGGRVSLYEASDNHDNNKPYIFGICADVTLVSPEGYVQLQAFDKIEVKIQADKYIIEDASLTFGNGTNAVSLQGNPLLNTATILQINNIATPHNMAEVIANNIMDDYKDGIRTATCSVGCLDYYYNDGTIAKDWSKGDIINIGDIVDVNGYDGLWRVTGRNFRYSGVPMLDLELQEVKIVG